LGRLRIYFLITKVGTPKLEGLGKKPIGSLGRNWLWKHPKGIFSGTGTHREYGQVERGGIITLG